MESSTATEEGTAMSVPATDTIDLARERWTEAEFLALPPNRRVELLDGSLLVSPAGSNQHQWLSFRLCVVLNAAAPRGLRVLEAVNVRIAPDRILIPDLAVIADPDMAAAVTPAAAVRLVVEITSPGSMFVDRALKPQLYAEAGIPHYLRIELTRGTPTALAYTLRGDSYVETARFGPGETTELADPFRARFDLAELLAG